MTQSGRHEGQNGRRTPGGWVARCALVAALSGAGWWTGCSSGPQRPKTPGTVVKPTTGEASTADHINHPAPEQRQAASLGKPEVLGTTGLSAGRATMPIAGEMTEQTVGGVAVLTLDAVRLRVAQDERFLVNASNLSLQSQTALSLDWYLEHDTLKPKATPTKDEAANAVGAWRDGELDPKVMDRPQDPRGLAGGEAERGSGKSAPAAAPAPVQVPAGVPAGDPGPAEKRPPSTPGGAGVGRPASGVTPEARRERVEVPLRVGGDDDATKKRAIEAGLVAEAVARPLAKFDEELWVIARPTPRAGAARLSPSPGVGTLWLGRGAGTRTAVLREYSAEATITGPVSFVTVTQRFENTSSETVDGVYVLPMPRDAAVTDFVMTVGSGESARKIRGVIRERAEAERIFLDAQKQGRVASLMGDDAANMLVQRIGNIAAGATVETSVTYFGTLDYAGLAGNDAKEQSGPVAGAYEFVLPMRGIAVVADGTTIGVTVKIDAGVEIVGGAGGVMSPTHSISTAVTSNTSRTVTMGAPLAVGTEGDFVLRYAVAGSAPRVGIVTQADGGQGGRGGGTYFSMLVTPPAAPTARPPMDVVIVPDISQSMSGPTLAAMRNAAAMLLGRLGPADRFALALGTNAETHLVPATPETVAAALQRVATMEHVPGRSLAATLRGVLSLGGERLVCVLSCGEVSEGLDVLREARVHRGNGGGASRVFAVSIDEPAGFALESLARIGRGGVIHLSSAADAGPANERLMARLLDREGSPVMTDLSIDWGGAEVVDVFPRHLPDLCPGRPVHVVGRLLSPPAAGKVIKVTGTVRGSSGVRRETLAAVWAPATVTPGAIPTLWARAKVLMLSEQLAAGSLGAADADAIRREIVGLALSHNLVSAMTAFVAVDAMSSVEPTAIEQATNVAPR